MNVREAFEKLQVQGPRSIGEPWMTEAELAGYLAPIIERALRAAYDKGYEDADYFDGIDPQKDNGVTAGVKVMVEEARELTNG